MAKKQLPSKNTPKHKQAKIGFKSTTALPGAKKAANLKSVTKNVEILQAGVVPDHLATICP